jgi:signal transduction histidine kinase
MRDTKGRLLNQDLLKAAKSGGGAVEFDFLNPGTVNVDPKVGWAEMETKTNCGP